ncbi:hypothetical protein Harman_33170 [Haloarcula mannanilytica]|uniref:Uncharacterized protein n=1 Tax=Haloarcula mannanilytica TaxID=2509225 RepID=A0A4C2EM52_9EURY|nr:hypothetical protein [Haloarcula mannanilytica]GCF15382.1 hypothetical protein Harman_33170 [Haloarcula mannanilytica]
MRTLDDGFDGVLATSVSTEAGAPPADLSYLTLTPLVAQRLLRDERDDGADRMSLGESPTGDQEGEADSPAPQGDELRVRELLRDDGDGTADSRDQHPTEMTVSEPQNRSINDHADEEGGSTRRASQTERSDGRSLTDWDGQASQPGGDESAELSERAEEWPASESPRTVVEQSGPAGGGPGTVGESAGRDSRSERVGPSSSERGGPGRESRGASERAPGDGIPTTVVHQGTPDGEGHEGATSGQSGPANDSGGGHTAPGDGRDAPGLTVTVPGVSEVSANADGASVPDASTAQRQSAPTDSETEEPSDSAITERTVIRSDGRLNERVFDRLYEEVSRKMRLERNREGR